MIRASLLGLALALPSPQEADTGPRESFHVYLLFGQSNMAGRGKVGKEDRTPHKRVFALTKANRWAPAVEPLHFDKPIAGVGPGLAFGKAMAKSDSKVRIGLVPCAAGGSPIESWTPGGYHGQTKSHPYDDALKRARIALKKGVLKGILWHQGESNAPDGYREKLIELVARLRKELQASDVPFIVGELGRFRGYPDGPNAKKNEIFQSVPTFIKRSACVSSEGLGPKKDNVHFTAAASRELGRRYAKAIQAISRKK